MGETNDWRLRLGGDCTDDAARWDNAAAAETLSATGPVFPQLSPFIGVLGAFTTGSNTYNNVVWGQIQQGTAVALNLSGPLILAAQTVGGAIGSLFAPAKVIVGARTVDGADDGQVLKLAMLHGLAIILIINLITCTAVRFK